MQENLFLKVALELQSKTTPTLLREHSRLEKAGFLLVQIMAFGLGKILFFSARSSNAFVRFLARKQSNVHLPPPDFRLFEPLRRQLREKPDTSVMFLVSHPLTTPQEAPLLAEMLFQSAALAQFLDERRRFKLVHAVDHFALDALNYWLRAFYSGLVLSAHVAVHRLPQDLSKLEKMIWRKMLFDQSIFAWISALKQGHFVFAALGGGIPSNARIFYTVKEWAFAVYRRNRLHSTGARKIQFALRLARELCRESACACAQGRLSSQERDRVLALLGQFMEESAARQALKELETELALDTPRRERLLKILLSRLCRRGRQLVIVPLRHSLKPDVKIEAPATILYVHAGASSITVQQGSAISTLSFEQFAFRFADNFLHAQPEN